MVAGKLLVAVGGRGLYLFGGRDFAAKREYSKRMGRVFGPT